MGPHERIQLERAVKISQWACALDTMIERGEPDICVIRDGSREEVITVKDAPETRIVLEAFAKGWGFEGGVEQARAVAGHKLSQQFEHVA